MLKNKKSLAVILSLVMLLAMACGAWAASARFESPGPASPIPNASGDISMTANNGYGLWAHDSGRIQYTGGTITTTGRYGYGAYANTSGDIKGSGAINVSNEYARGIVASNAGTLAWTGNITAGGYDGFGVYALDGGCITDTKVVILTTGETGHGVRASGTGSYINGEGDITTEGFQAQGISSRSGGDVVWSGDILTSNDNAHGIYVRDSASVDFTGNIETRGKNATGLALDNDTYAKFTGDITTYGEGARGITGCNNPETLESLIEFTGNITTNGDGAMGVYVDKNADVIMAGNITTTGEDATALFAFRDSSITITDGTISVADDGLTWMMYMSGDSTINLDGVTAEGQNLLKADGSGALNATDGSVLAGEVRHDGSSEGILDITLTNSSLNGTANASGDIGVININLEGSEWNITGESNTNGAVTGDGNSVIDYTLASDDTTVIIDSLKGNPELNIKPGDKLIIKDTDGVIVDFSSSDTDVITVIKTDDGYEITAVGDGPATVSLSYQLPDGGIVTYEFGVVSGSGNKPASNQPYSSGGGSSNCSAGFGATALLSLLGLALVLKRK